MQTEQPNTSRRSPAALTPLALLESPWTQHAAVLNRHGILEVDSRQLTLTVIYSTDWFQDTARRHGYRGGALELVVCRRDGETVHAVFDTDRFDAAQARTLLCASAGD